MIKSSDIREQMTALRFEPTRLQDLMFTLQEQALDGESVIVDPSMPFPYLMESAVVLTSAAVERDEILSKRQYPSLSTTADDLYFHMSDNDYEGVFATPAGVWFYIYVSKEEILSKAVKIGTSSTRKLTIPKHSYITVNGDVFTFQYPINIIVKNHGNIDVVYDSSKVSPLQTLTGNQISNEIVRLSGITEGQPVTDFVRMKIFLKQMRLTSYTHSLSSTTVLKKSVTLENNFYYARAFSKNSLGNWVEIKTTHSQQVFDPTDPTILLKVVGNVLTYELPYVYFGTSLVNRDIRIDVYTTNGEMNVDLSGLESNSYVLTTRDIDNDDNGIYSSPFGQINTLLVISDDVVTGGTSAITFEELRARVLNNALGDAIVPVVDDQMVTMLSEMGFDTSLVEDDLDARTYLATCPMPASTLTQASTGIDTSVETLRMSIADLLNYDSVIDNGLRVTITPKTLYKSSGGVLSIVPGAERNQIELLSGEDFVNKLNEGYLYSPFHYVLDVSNDEFELRPYYLSSPNITLASYANSNDTLGLTISSSSDKSIELVETGYRIVVMTSSNSAWKALNDDQVHVQLAFIPEDESDYAYINGNLLGKTSSGERIYEFMLETNWDINQNDLLILNNFSMYDALERDFKIQLTSELTLLWAVSDYTVVGAESSAVDTVLGKHLLPPTAVGVYQEIIKADLGDELRGMWRRSRATPGAMKYLTYTHNVQRVYQSNVYELDPDTNLPLIEEVDGVKSLKVLHRKGEFVFHEDGTPDWLHVIGDAVLDENGNPVPVSERDVQRWWDQVLFDAVYRYATDAGDVEYAESVPKTVVDYVNDSLAGIRGRLLPKTQVVFHPRNTIKRVPVIADDGIEKTITAAQVLTVEIYVNSETYKNSDVRGVLENMAIDQVVSALKNRVVSRTAIQASIQNNSSSLIMSVKITGFGGSGVNYDVITVQDESARLCVGKSLTTQPDGTYAVKDAITVVFKKHAA